MSFKLAHQLLFAGILLASSLGASAITNDECQKQYGLKVSQCAHDLDLLSPNIRAGAQKACVEDAKLFKAACQSGANQCLDNCQATYASSLGVCNTTYDPVICGGNPTCEAAFIALKAECTSAAVDALNLCTASCQ